MCLYTVILQVFGVVLFSVISVVSGFTEIKRHLNEKITLSDYMAASTDIEI